MMKSSGIFILFLLTICISDAITFREVVVIPRGSWYRTFGFDTDHDGRENLVFSTSITPFNIQFWEYVGFDQYFPEDSAPDSWLYDIGYLDTDSLVDMVGNENGIWPYPLYVYESPTYNSNPTNIVWQDSGFMNIYGGYITDLDQDGLKEILFGYYDFEGPHTCVYENIGDNQYLLVWEDTINPFYGGINGDFDLDGKMEFITPWGGYPGVIQIHIWECCGNNNYESVFTGMLPHGSAEVFKGNDMDGNGKPELLVTCVSYHYGKAWLYLYEAVGDNNYDFFLVDSITNIPGSMWGHVSSCGDIDADGREEIVWSTFNQWHVYKATGVHQYQKIYSSDWTYNTATYITVYDLNRNGYPEVIEAGRPNHILIWEIQGVKILQPNYGYILHPGENYQIIWQKFDPPGADSFALFFSSDSSNTYDTIAMGIPGNDTTYQWIVPDIISDSCKIMIWAYGPPRPGENTPRGIACDFGDFKIRPLGIEMDKRYEIRDVSLKILQNPVSGRNLKIQYAIPRPVKVRLAIYNVLGQVERILVDEFKSSGIYESNLNENLPNGIYFIQLKTQEKIITRKIIKLR
ncbi:MAG: T9SS type A sorting domain-containing protein [bacterium]